MVEKLSGIIERITFHNPENGFAVLRVRVRGFREPVPVVGTLLSVAVGEQLDASGTWVEDRDHGSQFKATELQTKPPCTLEGIEKYLASGLIKGIGPHYARRIVETFGERTLSIIDESPSYLTEVKGIGPRRLEQIRESWQRQRGIRQVMMFLQAYGLGTARAARIYRTYGDQAIELIKSNPYRLAEDIWGIGFQLADQLAERLGVDRQSAFRARSALIHVLKRLTQEGHSGFPEEGVVEQTQALTEIEPKILREAVAAELATHEVIRDSVEATDGRIPWLYLAPYHKAEAEAARILKSLCCGRHPLGRVDADAALAEIEQRMVLELASAQKDAIRLAAREKVLVITGGPGVGKTTIVRGILELFKAQGRSAVLCAPTGRAAKRLAETTGQEARTIHRLLEFDHVVGGFKRNADHRLRLDLLIVDESSMVDLLLLHHLVQAIPERACVVFVGDVDQLPSVGAGNVLSDLIGSRVLPVVRLTEIFRQAGQSWIIRAAHQVHEGQMPESAPAKQGDFYVIEAHDPPAILEKVVRLLADRIPSHFGLDPVRDVQVLTPMNRSELGSRALNTHLQQVLNPPRGGTEIQRHGWTFRLNDKVIQTVNDYQKEVFNGDIGRIVQIDESEQEVAIEYEGRVVVYDFDELDEVGLAYALTVHKSQGSEYPAVIVPLHTQHYLMLQRNLLYTAISRGRKLVVLVGSRRALGLAIGRQDARQRCSRLAARLRE